MLDELVGRPEQGEYEAVILNLHAAALSFNRPSVGVAKVAA
jgi:hypothetical protein